MIGSAYRLIQQEGIKLTVASLSSLVNEITFLKGESIDYYIIPYGKGNKRVNHSYEPLWKEVKEKVKPDVVHIHGTEYTHGLAYIEACGTENVCISIQGLVSAYYYYYYYGLTSLQIIKSVTPASIINGGIWGGLRDFIRRGECEKEVIKRVNHIIGRTSWDRDRTWAINPEATYHYCGETLREEFYSTERWSYNKCTPHSIFISQAWMPLKGLHQVLRAMPLVLRHFPDTKIRVAGGDVTRGHGWLNSLKISDYGNIIRKLIKKNGLYNKVVFAGNLDAKAMRDEYLRSNVFICPSAIENSPNSLGEAQVLGVPVLASYAGGTPDMMKGDEEHLYRFEEIEMLAHKIVKIFEQEGAIDTALMQSNALKRHDPAQNVLDLVGIYEAIGKSSIN